ncbi:mechanosensitive ion channel [Sulfurovum sp. zt1-1]|uniref:Mechanosensitive ion channel n=1 Tax=Sulfurovum zhangzhouensis TaxID=3019067 RepID=A0ABT7QYY7_9BACT|nr:mechanosensitive ion channel domain-containing protein [Sulfurovum zhangzhouensis]MDM5272054.1 mechanosensitive ion channel [Sulfurovum zhangzhouensis]
MKLLWSFLILTITLWCIPVDTKLYEGENTLIYYDQLSQKLFNITPMDDEETERLQNEKVLLGKLKLLIINEPQVQTFDASLLEKETVSETEFLKLFEMLSSAVEQKKKLEEIQVFTQERLGYLKKSIESVTDPQYKNLQLYQLQFAYYKLKHRHDELTVKSLTPFIEEGENTLSLLITKVKFDIKKIQSNVDKVAKELENINKKLIAANLTKERELLSQEHISKKLSEKIEKLTKEKDHVLLKLADKEFLTGFYYFQTKVFKSVLQSQKKIHSILSQLSYQDTLLDAKLEEFERLSKESKEAINYNVLSLRENLLSSYEKFYESFQKPFVVLDETPISFLSILKLLGILLIGFIIARIYFRLFIMLHKKRKETKAVSIKIIANLGVTLILFAAFVIALGSIGLSITHLAVIAGALSIGLGFALRSIVSSMISGMVLLSEKYIKTGDYITIKGDLTGKVMDIGYRATHLRTIDNIDIVIPNSELIDSQVINLTMEDRIRRIYVPFKVPYGSDIKKISSLITTAVMESKIKLIRDIPRKKPNVWMQTVGESFIELELLVWIEGIRPSTRSNLLILIYETLQANGINMPLPQLDVHLGVRKPSQRPKIGNMAYHVKS